MIVSQHPSAVGSELSAPRPRRQFVSHQTHVETYGPWGAPIRIRGCAEFHFTLETQSCFGLVPFVSVDELSMDICWRSPLYVPARKSLEFDMSTDLRAWIRVSTHTPVDCHSRATTRRQDASSRTPELPLRSFSTTDGQVTLADRHVCALQRMVTFFFLILRLISA
ncbi:hypothetical protein BDY19DRAFT_258882 [Irpex rosettiformis]|uniref:Uncharacterized protein n=1 Tax=Irpex rosettiformis TaxID=378272 RepID=A0ACB8UGZ8_9APHY|nr:hypothetical protein BDY19DRAFT_258882 [Irpex rosettiformis]